MGPRSRIGKVLLIGAEIALVLVILALLLITWLPALIGPHAGPPR